MMRTLNIEAGFSTLDKARRQIIDEIRKAKCEVVRVQNVIHGYLFARHEHGERLPAEAVAALEKLGFFCELNKVETHLVCELFAAELATMSDEEK